MSNLMIYIIIMMIDDIYDKKGKLILILVCENIEVIDMYL